MSNTFNLVRVSDGSQGGLVSGSNMYRQLPEPRGGQGAWSALSNVVSTAGSLLGGTSVFGNPADITGLLNKQIEIQMVMQLVSMESNIARSKHETEMAPIRNMRIG
jgi:hypothetical protein